VYADNNTDYIKDHVSVIEISARPRDKEHNKGYLHQKDKYDKYPSVEYNPA
jgi:hypothetical protein